MLGILGDLSKELDDLEIQYDRMKRCQVDVVVDGYTRRIVECFGLFFFEIGLSFLLLLDFYISYEFRTGCTSYSFVIGS